ncbi:MAG: ATP-binding protein, partial [Firmicutes bacterium]|nr:ATP-binding protein [Bacillota bacterium]
FFQLKRRDETFDQYLALYAGAEELSMVAAAGTKKLYEDKAREYLRLVNKWLRENIQEAFEIIYQGTGKPVKEWITGLPPQASTTEIVDHVAANCLAGWFDQKYPDYPHFIRLRTPMTTENFTSYVQDALQSIAGEPTRNGLAILHGLVLMEDEKLNVRNSGYAKWILNKLEEKEKGQVVNRSELITTLYTCYGTEDLEQTQEFAMEPELLVVLLAALVYNGDIVITINGNSYDAMKFDQLIKLPINELKAFSHIKRPSGLPLPELRVLFDFLGIAPGLLQERALEEGVRELNRKTNHLLSQTLSVLQIVRSQIPTWEEPLLTENEKDTYERILLKFQEFLEKILIFNTPAKLHNFRYSIAEIEEQQQAKDLLKKITDLQQRAQEVTPFATYLKIAQPQLPDSHPWQQQATAALDALWQALRRGEPCQNEKAAVLRLKTEYQELYLALHAKARLNASEESKVQDLLASQEMTALKQLATIDLVPTRQLEQLLEELSESKACWQLAKADLDNQPLCPYCKFRPKDEQITKGNIGDYEDRVQDLLEQWTTMLMTNLNDPEVKKSIELLGEEGQKLINEFLQNQAFVFPINIRLLQALKESLQGIERVEIPLTDLISALGGGTPLTIEEARQRFEKMLASHIGTQATQRIRIMLKLPGGEE